MRNQIIGGNFDYPEGDQESQNQTGVGSHWVGENRVYSRQISGANSQNVMIHGSSFEGQGGVQDDSQVSSLGDWVENGVIPEAGNKGERVGQERGLLSGWDLLS